MLTLVFLLVLYLQVAQTPVPPAISYVASIIGAIAAGAAVVLTALTQLHLSRQDKKLDSVKKTSEATHLLTNSAMGVQLLSSIADKEALSVVLHTVAKASGSPADLAAATAIDVRVEAAKKLYQEHVINQAVVDATKNANSI